MTENHIKGGVFLKPVIYVTIPIKEEIERYLTKHCIVRKWEGKDPISRQDLLEEIADVEGLFTAGARIDGELLNHAPKLKVVSNFSVGYNNFDLDAMRKRGVIGTNT